MIISNVSIKNKTTVLVMVFLITVIGIYSYITLPRESNPDIKFPYVMVMSNYQGASPSDMETLVTYPIERKLKKLTDVKQMTSTSSEGMSMVTLEFEPEVDIDTALQKVRDKVNEAKGELPSDLDDPSVMETSANDLFPLLYVNISGNVNLIRLKKIAEDMQDDIEMVSGVLEVELLGGLEREIRVEFDSNRLAAYGLTMSEIVQTVTQNNKNTPGGSIDIGEAKYSLKIPAEFSSPEEIDHLVVAIRDNKPVYLSDIAVAIDTFKDRESFSRVDGKESVTLKVKKRSGVNILKMADQVKAIAYGYKDRVSKEVDILITSDSSKDIKLMVDDLENNIITGFILVLIVVFIAMGFRNSVIVASAIPISLFLGFIIIQSLGMTLNMVVLFALVLALGMLVDNAIVIVENIYRHHTREGKPIMQAAMEGTSEVAWPVISSTATTVAAFIPLLFWPGIMGEFLSYLPKTVIIVLSTSLFVAMVITPVLALIFIKAKKVNMEGDEEQIYTEGIIIKTYAKLLKFNLRYRVLSLLLFFSMLIIVAFAYITSGLGVEMFPDTEPTYLSVKIESPEGTNIYRSNKFALQAEEIINKYGNIDNITASVTNNEANISIVMVDKTDRKATGTDGKIYFSNSNKTLESIRLELTSKIVGAKVTVDKQEHGPPVGEPVNVEIAGEDYKTLTVLAEQLKEDIHDLPGVVDLTDDAKTGLPEINVIVDKERAALLGLNAFLIGEMVKASINGTDIGDYKEGEDEYDITARLPENQRGNISDILNLRIPSITGEQVPLTSVADVITETGLSSIKHIDNKRVVTVSSKVAEGFNSQQVLSLVQAIAKNGRFSLRNSDIKDFSALLSKLKESDEPTIKNIKNHFDKEVLEELNNYNKTDQLTAKFKNGVLRCINKSLNDTKLVSDNKNKPKSIRESDIIYFNRSYLTQILPIAAAPPAISMPAGYYIRYTGENEDMDESRTFVTKAFFIALLLIALVLVTQFNSVLTPFIIMTSVVLSFIGVFFGLVVTHKTFGIIMTGMGVISLAGVVVNNAIVLLDYINVLRRRGLDCAEAVVTAGCTRFRPVMLTAVTTVLGMIPMAIGISYNFKKFKWEVASEMSEFWGTMATVVISGLTVATLLTLFVVPSVYSLFFDFNYYKKSKEEKH